jgi:hypothetical protein
LNKIELWDVEPYESKDKLPKWCWELILDNGTLLNPIIAPYDSNWKIKYTYNSTIIFEDKVKYFLRQFSEDYGWFLYIVKL